MRSILVGILIVLSSSLAVVSQPIRVSMLEVVQNSDHVLVVHVVGVDMIDGDGNEITDPSAGTGPGSKSLIRLKCSVLEIHRTNAEVVPKELWIPLDGFMHYSLGQIQNAHEGDAYPVVVVLAGDQFQPAFDGKFRYRMQELETVLALYDENRTKH